MCATAQLFRRDMVGGVLSDAATRSGATPGALGGMGTATGCPMRSQNVAIEPLAYHCGPSPHRADTLGSAVFDLSAALGRASAGRGVAPPLAASRHGVSLRHGVGWP